MDAPSILIVHSDRKTQRTVQRILGATGYRVDVADHVEQGMRLLAHLNPVLVVVDGGLLATDRDGAPEAPLARSARSGAIGDLFDAAKARGTEACMTLLGAAAAGHVPAILGMGSVTNLLVHQMPVLGEELTITCSAGIAELPLDGLDAGTLLARADQRLLAAKRAGRDRLHADDRERVGQAFA